MVLPTSPYSSSLFNSNTVENNSCLDNARIDEMLPRPTDSSYSPITPHQHNNAPISAQSSGSQAQTAGDSTANADIGDPVRADPFEMLEILADSMLQRLADPSDSPVGHLTPHQDNNAPISAQSSGAQSQTAGDSNANADIGDPVSLGLVIASNIARIVELLLNRGYVIAKDNFDLCRDGRKFSDLVQELRRDFPNGSDGFGCWDALVKCPRCPEVILYSIRMEDCSKMTINQGKKLHPFLKHKEKKGCSAHDFLSLYYLFCTECDQPFASVKTRKSDKVDIEGGCRCTREKSTRRKRSPTSSETEGSQKKACNNHQSGRDSADKTGHDSSSGNERVDGLKFGSTDPCLLEVDSTAGDEISFVDWDPYDWK